MQVTIQLSSYLKIVAMYIYLAFTMASIVSLSCGLNWPLPVSILRVTWANLQRKQNKNNEITNVNSLNQVLYYKQSVQN
jgi:hypothetical protein